MNTAFVLACAMILDAALGEPDWLWSRLRHPAVLFGDAVGFCDRRFNRGTNRRGKGVAVAAALAVGALILGALLAQLGWVAEILICAVLLAQRSLVQHVQD
ncbi:cobalamin biosynthesis protein, partial [Cribrihabitans sp. XS_ASV171]